MREAALAFGPAADPPDPRLASARLHAEHLRREIIASALDEAELIVAEARQVAAARRRELVRRAEEIAREHPLRPAVPPPAQALAGDGGSPRSEAILQRAAERATRLREAADADVAAIEKESRRRRRRLERELRSLVRERDDLVRELSARVVAVRTAGRVAERRPPRKALRAGLAGAAVVAVAIGAGVAGHELSPGQAAPRPLSQPVLPTAARTLCPVPARFRPVFAAAARHERIPLSLLTAVAAVESRFDLHARSARGAVGLMQLMPATARDLGVDPFRWRANVRGGARYLRQMLDRFGGNVSLALAGYNAGGDAVARGNVSLETMLYVAAVTAKRSAIAGCR